MLCVPVLQCDEKLIHDKAFTVSPGFRSLNSPRLCLASFGPWIIIYSVKQKLLVGRPPVPTRRMRGAPDRSMFHALCRDLSPPSWPEMETRPL